MQVSDSFTASLTGPKSTQLHAVKGDGARMVAARLFAGTEPWEVPEDVVGGISYELPDGTEGYYEQLTDGTPACTVSGNQVCAVIAPGLCRRSGTVRAVIVLRKDGRQISTFPFELQVAERPGYPELEDAQPDGAPAFAGKLFFGDEGGNPIPLGIGDGLIISDGLLEMPVQVRPVLHCVTLVSGDEEVNLFAQGDNLTISGRDGEPVNLSNLAEPEGERDAAHKGYVDSVAAELWAEIRYVPIRITDFICAKAKLELGTVLDSLALSWGINKMPVSQTLDGAALPVETRSFTVPGPISGSRKFTLAVTDERDAQDSMAATVLFCNGIYYGSLAAEEQIDSDRILALTRVLRGDRFVTMDFDPAGKRPTFALPVHYGKPIFMIGGFAYEWSKIGTIDFTNRSGYTEAYDVWQHPQDVSERISVRVE